MQPDRINRRTFLAASAAAVGGAALGAELPAGVREVTGVLGSFNRLVGPKGGSPLSHDGRLSRDDGLTWTAPRSFGDGVAGAGFLRLKSGALALVSQIGYASGKIWLSRDEGASWQLAGTIRTPGGPVFELGDTLIQLDRGRL